MTIVRPLPQDAMTPAQLGRIQVELLRLKPTLPYDEEAPWLAEINARCNLNIESWEELTKREASKIIDQLKQ